jgi:hypothetical protein
MAKASRAVSVESDSSAEVERGVARQTSSKKRKSSSGKAKRATPSPVATEDDQPADDEEQADEEEEEEEVYEIEKIIKAEMGRFQPVSLNASRRSISHLTCAFCPL